MGMTVQEIVEHIEARMRNCPLRGQLAEFHHLKPTHIRDITERLREFGVAISRIEGDMNKEWKGSCERFARRWEYEQWRHRAKRAALYLRQEKLELTNAMKDARCRVDALSVGVDDTDNPHTLLGALVGVFKAVGRRQGWGYLTQDEITAIHLAQQYLQDHLHIEVPVPLSDDGEDDEIEWATET